MNLIWKLLRKHISAPQLVGFFFANLLGMLIIMLAIQFYCDVSPLFSRKDSFIKSDFMVVSKQINMISALGGRNSSFSSLEINELHNQKFCKNLGAFISSAYKIRAGMGMAGSYMKTQMFFESVPDRFIDVAAEDWHFQIGDNIVPIILPRSYLALYNFGFAQSHSLPKLTENFVGMINLDLSLYGNGKEFQMKGHIVGFSNRLNTILVPESFMLWSNSELAPNIDSNPSRLIIEVHNPTDDSIIKFLQQKGYETEGDKLYPGQTTHFLKIISGVIISVGLLISALSFYVLMLSIYLLIQKNASKLENLLLMGYPTTRVALPYQLLTVAINATVWLTAAALLILVRNTYMEHIISLFPQITHNIPWIAFVSGLILCLLVSVINIYFLRKKVIKIWTNNRQ